MTGVLRALGLVGDRWARLERSSVWSALALVVVAWGLMAVNRFGGLSFDAPRAVARFALVGIWGWLALSVAIWSMANVLSARSRPPALGWHFSSLQLTLAIVGWAHAPVVALAVVILVAAGALQLFGPGFALAVVVFALLLPLALVTGVRHVFQLRLPVAVLAVSLPYLGWLLVVARHLLGQIQHLL